MDESLRELERQFSQNPTEALRRQVATAYRRQGRLFDAWRLIRNFKDWPERRELSLAMWQEQKNWFDARPGSREAFVQWAPTALGAHSEGKASSINTLIRNPVQGHIYQLKLDPSSRTLNKRSVPEFEAGFKFISSLIGGDGFKADESAHTQLTNWLSGFKFIEHFNSQSNLHWWPVLPSWPHLTRIRARFLHLRSHEELNRFPKLKSLSVGTFSLLSSADNFQDNLAIQHVRIRQIYRPEQYLLFSFLPKLKALESLALGFSLHGDEMETLGRFKKLKQLTLRFETLSAERLQMLSSLHEMRSLTLSRCAISNEAMERLLQFPKLQSLSLVETEFENNALSHLVGLSKLENLELSKTPLDDNGLSELKRFPSLKRLWIQTCPLLGRNSTDLITDIPQLEEIDFNLTRIDKLRLQATRPDVTILNPIESPFTKHSSLKIH
ncbi:MAG: hypothetical protein P1V97_24065 [Planctomycetota bacterium]|nr:hypothetical protein [Planctomycetota bacterium]